MLPIIFYCFLALNLLTFIIYGIDKLKAKNAKWRISESTLIFFAIIGGSIGAWLGLQVWRHKTQHKKFYIGIPVILILQVVATIYVLTLIA